MAEISFTELEVETLSVMTDMDSRLQMSAFDNDEQRKTVTLIDAEYYKAAAKGRFVSFEGYDGQFDRLLTPNRNTILHIYLSCRHNKSTEFIGKALEKCSLLVGQANENDDTPLHIAARFNHSEAAKLLIERAKAPSEKDPESGEEAVVKARKMIRMVNKQKATALHEAARFDSVDVVRAILAIEDLEFTYSTNECGETPLYLAAYWDRNETLREILSTYNDKPVAYGGPNGKTALHAAVMRNNADAVNKIVEKMSNLVKEADEYGWTPLHYAAYVEESGLSISIVRKLLEVDKTAAYVKDKDWKRTALHIAACRGNESIMRRIISECPDCCELTDIRGWNVLHYAAINDSDDVLKEVLETPSIINLVQAKDVEGYTPIHLHLLLYSFDINVWISRLANIGDKYMLYSVREDMDYSSQKEELRKWTEDLGDGPFGKIFVRKVVRSRTNWRERERERQEKTIPELEKAKDAHLVAAALVATVTFAAAFTLPGGFVSGEGESKQKQGTPILSANSAFKAFVISDAIAMVLSTASVFIQYIMVMLGYKRKYFWLMSCCMWFTVFAMGAMVVAFVTGTYAVLSPSPGLAITTCLIGLSFFLYVFYAILRLVRANRQWIGYIRYYICNIVGAIRYYICDIVETIRDYICDIVETIREMAVSIRHYICDILETIREMVASIMY